MCTDSNRAGVSIVSVVCGLYTLLVCGMLAGAIYEACNPDTTYACPGCGASDDYCCVSSKQLCDGCFCDSISISADSSEWWCHDKVASTTDGTVLFICGGILLGIQLLVGLLVGVLLLLREGVRSQDTRGSASGSRLRVERSVNACARCGAANIKRPRAVYLSHTFTAPS
jgi:hypothetical protein